MAISDDQMTIDDLAEIYRVEKKSGSLMNVRSDFYKATALLLKNLRAEYDKQLAKDPDSIICEGFNTRRKKGDQLSKEIVEIRMGKICKMALRGAMGADNATDALTAEEKEYYEKILLLSKDHKSILARLSGRMTYKSPDVTSIISAPPVPKEEPQPEMEPVEEYYEPEDEDIPVPAPRVEQPPKEAEIQMDVVPEEGIMMMDENVDLEEPEIEQNIPDDDLDRLAPGEPVKRTPDATVESDLVLVRILEEVGTFAGPMRNCTLHKENIAYIPSMIAQVLVNRGMAEKITTSS